MRFTRALALGASIVVLVSACSTGGGSSSPSQGSAGPASAAPAASTSPKPTVKVGSDGFYEAKVMAEIYAQALEAAGYTVDRAGIGIGSRKVSAPALESGQIDLKPEYIGSGLAFYEPGKQTATRGPTRRRSRRSWRPRAAGSRSSPTRRRPTRTRSSSGRTPQLSSTSPRSAMRPRSRTSSSGASRPTARRTRSAPWR